MAANCSQPPGIGAPLLQNGDFALWNPTETDPLAWQRAGAAGTVERRPSLTHAEHPAVYYQRTTADVAVFQDAPVGPELVSCGIWVNADVTGNTYLMIEDGVRVSLSDRNTLAGEWQQLSVDHSLDPKAAHIRFTLIITSDLLAGESTPRLTAPHGAAVTEASCVAVSPSQSVQVARRAIATWNSLRAHWPLPVALVAAIALWFLIRRPRSALRTSLRMGLAIASVLVSLLAVEAAIRLFGLEIYAHPTEYFLGDRIGGFIHEYDPTLGWRLAPNRRHVVNGELVVSTDADGRRRNGPTPAANATRMVLVQGDSFAFGYFLKDDETIPAVLERELSTRTGQATRVLNAGVGGYGTDHEYLQFPRIAEQIRPDVDVLLFFANDIWANAASGVWGLSKPLVTMSPGCAIDGMAGPAPSPVGDARGDVETSASRPRGLVDRSRLVDYWRMRAAPLLTRWLWLDGPPKQAVFPGVQDFRLYESPLGDRKRHEIELSRCLLRALDQEVRAANSRLLVVFIPEKIDFFPAQLALSLRHAGIGRSDPTQVRAIYKQWAAEESFATLDLYETFRPQIARGRGIYWEDDGHLSPRGAALAAGAIADKVITMTSSSSPH